MIQLKQSFQQNANCAKCKVQNAQSAHSINLDGDVQCAKCKMQGDPAQAILSAKCKMQNAKCKVQSAKFKMNQLKKPRESCQQRAK